MVNVDRAIAAGGIALLVVAAGSLLYVQEFYGLETVTFPIDKYPLDNYGPSRVEGAPTTFTWANYSLADASAFGANLTVVIEFNGRAIAGGSATVEAILVAPNEAYPNERVTRSFTLAPGETSATFQFQITQQWATVPDERRANPSQVDEALEWDKPLELRLSVESPAEPIGQAANYAFDATVSGHWLIYRQEPAK